MLAVTYIPTPLTEAQSILLGSGGHAKVRMIDDDGLKALASDILLILHVNTSNRKYQEAFEKWSKWAAKFDEVSRLPCDPFLVALCLIDMCKSTGPSSTSSVILPALTWAYRMGIIPSPGHTEWREYLHLGIQNGGNTYFF
jgi:hypothetical protein